MPLIEYGAAKVIETLIGGLIEHVEGKCLDFGVENRERLLGIFKQSELPINHDLQRTYRLSVVNATWGVYDALTQLRERESREEAPKESGWKAEMTALWAVGYKIGQMQDEASKAAYGPPTKEALEQLELLMRPRNVNAEQRILELKQSLLQDVLEEMSDVPLPKRWRSFLLEGWDEQNKQGENVHVEWFDLLCLHFQDYLKKNEHVRAAFQHELLAKIVLQGQATNITLAQFEEQLARQSSHISSVEQRLERIENQMEVLVRESRRRKLRDKYYAYAAKRDVQDIIDRHLTLFVGRGRL